MKRISVAPRPEWQRIVESQGMLYHTIDGEIYWDESAYYEFSPHEIDELEKATYELDRMCLEAVERVITEDLFARFNIIPPHADYIRRSWETDEVTIYGRFDLAYDGSGPPKLLEYNADTPTALLEAAVVQWFWLKDFEQARFDQYNSIHDRLIEAWTSLKRDVGGTFYFTAMADQVEDVMTVTYLQDTATQAGLKTGYIDLEKIGWDEQMKTFVDLKDDPVWNFFKLYPWEWMLRDEFAEKVLQGNTRWFEPSWKLLLSNKMILTILWEMFPESPYLLETRQHSLGGDYIRKPVLGREGANAQITEYGITTDSREGPYANDPVVYQQLARIPCFDGNYPVLGSWMVNGYACGLGIREDTHRITGNTSRFVPHVISGG